MKLDLVLQLMAAGLPPPLTEFPFHPTRRWRFDYAWPSLKLAVEQEGGTWCRGRHVRPKGYEADCEKYSEAALMGWRVLRFTTDMIRDGRALSMIIRAFQGIGRK